MDFAIHLESVPGGPTDSYFFFFFPFAARIFSAAPRNILSWFLVPTRASSLDKFLIVALMFPQTPSSLFDLYAGQEHSSSLLRRQPKQHAHSPTELPHEWHSVWHKKHPSSNPACISAMIDLSVGDKSPYFCSLHKLHMVSSSSLSWSGPPCATSVSFAMVCERRVLPVALLCFCAGQSAARRASPGVGRKKLLNHLCSWARLRERRHAVGQRAQREETGSPPPA
jgi:hypothetical protein